MLGGGRKADRVAGDLLRRIVGGSIPVGALLPKEPDLALEYGVNRSVVREAIKLLEVHRLVRPIKRRGTAVLDPMASVSPEVLQAMLVPSEGRVDRARLRDYLEIRATLDVQMSVLAAERRTEADLEALDRQVDVLATALGDRERYHHEADRFARLVARATQNRIFEMLVWWNQEVATELRDVLNAVRPATEPHLTGVRTLVRLFRERDAASVRMIVGAYHDWASPRVLAAAALSTGESLSTLISGDHAR
ncbi:MAG: FadR family transcriptional regulator [Sandaracinaceae bacterium]|nr:FadR family transcriptional regulator [Sandaracinaceae bacterium]